MGRRRAGQEDQQSIDLFEKKYPEIKVKPDFQDYVSFWEKFQTQASGGNPPDVFQYAVTFLRKYDRRGVLLDLESQIDAGNQSLDNFRAGVTKVGEVDGGQLGIPVGSNTMALVIDRKVFQQAGVEPETDWTWADHVKALKTIHDKTKVPGDTGYFSIMYLYDLYLRQNGKAFYPKDGLGFDKADLTERWQDDCNRVNAGLQRTGSLAWHKDASLDYCRCFNAAKAEQAARYGSDFGTLLLFQGHTRLDAYAAVQTGGEALAKRAWTKFYGSDGYTESAPWKTERLSGPASLVAGSEASAVSTNDTALYGLAAFENLALLGDKMPS